MFGFSRVYFNQSTLFSFSNHLTQRTHALRQNHLLISFVVGGIFIALASAFYFSSKKLSQKVQPLPAKEEKASTGDKKTQGQDKLLEIKPLEIKPLEIKPVLISEIVTKVKLENEKKPINLEFKSHEKLSQYQTHADLLQAAQNYLNHETHKDIQIPVFNFPSLKVKSSDKEVIEALLQTSQGFCAGESHNEDVSKRFFIKNMELFQQNKVKVIGFEGISYDEQAVVDAYLNDTYLGNPEMEAKVQGLLNRLQTSANGPMNSEFRDDKILEAAKKFGIRIIAIDVPENLCLEHPKEEFDVKKRRTLMNFTAGMVMEEVIGSLKKDEKYLCLMGRNHVLRTEESMDVAGVADLLQSPAVLFTHNFGVRAVGLGKNAKSNFNIEIRG